MSRDDSELTDAIARYAASARDVEWIPPSELRQRASSRRRRRRITLGSTGSLMLAACVALSLALPSGAPAPRTGRSASRLAGSVRRVVVAPGSASEVAVETGEQQFALQLTQKLVTSGQLDNVVVSPESIETVLTMLELGARGSTQHEIAGVLDGSNLSPAEEAAGWNALTAELASDATTSGGTLTDENEVFLQRTLGVRQAYLNALGRNFGVGVERVDFAAGSAAAARAINAWASGATNGRVPQLFGTSSLPKLTSLVLADAVRFSATWKFRFQDALTKPGRFYLAGSRSESVPMMLLNADLTYFSTNRLEGVVLPYVGGTFEAIAVEPRTASLSAVVSELTPAALAGLSSTSGVDDVDLMLPRFSVGSEVSLDDALQRLGLGGAFMSGANFSGITASQVRLGTVAQRDVLSVDENGTDVDAVSAASSSPYDTHGRIQKIAFDHPFLFVIRDNATGAIVTEAIVNDPSGSR